MSISNHSDDNASTQQQALCYLQSLIADNPLYAIIDAGQDETIVELLHQHQKQQMPIQSLFSGKKGQEMASVAPYLVQINTPDNALLKIMLEQGWGKHWAVYFSYSGDFNAARNQLRQCIRVKGSNNEHLTFRFYDPRVFRQYIPTFDMSQLIAFYGAIESYWVEDKNATGLLRYQLRELQLDVQPIDIYQIEAETKKQATLTAQQPQG